MRREAGRPKLLFEKIWDAHVVSRFDNETVLLYIDRHLVNEVTSPQAFESLRLAGRQVRCPGRTMAVADHNVPTDNVAARFASIQDPASRLQIETLERNVTDFAIPYVPLHDKGQGIVHVIAPELGLTVPGTTIVCGDSHTSTLGAFGVLAFGIGTSEVEHVLATQTLVQRPAKSMLIKIDHALGQGVTAKDLVLHLLGLLGSQGAVGHVIEYAGEAVVALDMAGRMTLCNMSIELGAKAGMIAPDEKVYAWLADTPYAPKGTALDEARAYWESLRSDEGGVFDRVIHVDAREAAPMVTWGTSPDAVITVNGVIPEPSEHADPTRRLQAADMLKYMGLRAGAPIIGTPLDVVFIGSCTNGRIEDLRAAASMIRGRKVASGVRALVVPGSGAVRAAACNEGLDRIFLDAGFEWRLPGCSMCLGMNPDQLLPGQRCAATSNRNFEGRQGAGGRTHLMSPAMAAAAALAGCVVDAREA